MRYRTWLVAGAALLLGPAERPPQHDDLLDQAGRNLARWEYHASESHLGLQAPNRAQNLRTYFEPTGIRLHDRSTPGAPELLSLSLAGLGRGDALAAVEPGDVTSLGTRVEIRREGLVEWYENSAAGLEQGFTLAQRPAGEGALALDLALRGATASQDDAALSFASASGRQLRYDKLIAFDASGRELAARLSAPARDRVRIEVDDAGATYPIVIDPLIGDAASARLLADQAPARLGYSVAGAGDVNGDGYDDVIVGAPSYDSGEFLEGAAFVFLGSASGIADGGPASAHARLESNQVEAYFGWSVAGAGDVNGDGFDDVIVGAWRHTAGEANEGGAFVFLGSAEGIANGSPSTAAARLEAGQADSYFGFSVASAGDVNGDDFDDVIVGAMGYAVARLDGMCHCLVYDHPNEGAAFVFLGGANGIEDGDPDSAASVLRSNQTSGYFARSVAGAGDVNGDGFDDVVVGSPHFDVAPSVWGTALVFLGSAAGIADADPSSAATRLESDADLYGSPTHFGWSVAGAGDVNGDGFDDLIVGAPEHVANPSQPGAAFVFVGNASGIPDGGPGTAATWLVSGDVGRKMGGSVAGAGDVNADGYDDVIVGTGEPALDGGDTAYVFVGSASGIANGAPETASARLEVWFGDFATGIGWSVAGAGDVNDDGFDDLITGDPNFTTDDGGHGHALVFLGSTDADVDGNLDFADNCKSVPNADQIDRDFDGSGNRCDGDFDQNGRAGLSDYATFLMCFGMPNWSAGPPADEYCVESDMDANGGVGLSDFALFRQEFGTPPGP